MAEKRSVSVAISLDVEEEGLFSGNYERLNPSIKNTARLGRLAPLLERGVKPTLFCAHSAFADPDSRKVLADMRDRHGAEIGAHLHHWNTPPLGGVRPGNGVATASLPLTLLEAKLKNLFAGARDFQGAPVTSFRMGRWDLRREHWPVLRECGVLCDASVRPLHCAAAETLGPDHFAAPPDPYWVDLGDGKILEVPLTVRPVLPAFSRLASGVRFGSALRPGLKNWGVLAMLPQYHPLPLMKLATLAHLERGGAFLSLAWHSSEMMAGGAPHMPDEEAVESFLRKMTRYLDWLENKFEVKYLTMTEIRANGQISDYPFGGAGADWTWSPQIGKVEPRQDQPSAANSENPLIDANLPHVAYVLLWYPLFTQPFIFREVEELRKITPLEVYTLYGRNLRRCSEEMKLARHRGRSYGLRKILPILGALISDIFFRPRLTWSLFRRSCLRKWPNIEVFGENLWAFCAGSLLSRQFREDGIDFVYAPWPRGAATAAWVAASLAGLPFAIAARGDNLEPADPDLDDKLRASEFARANNAADQKRLENFASGGAKGKTVLIYNSLTLSRPAGLENIRRLESLPIRLLAVGRFDVTKGFDVLLRACAELEKRGLDFRLTLAGGGGKVMGLGDLDQSLRDLRKKLRLEDLVEMPGLVSHNELPKILENHDIFVAPCIIHESGRRDGIPNTVIEAMAFAMPVVSSNVNALPEIVRDGKTGLTVNPGDPLALADAIIWLSSHPAEAKQYGANGAALVAEIFNPAVNARLMANVFSKSHAEWLRNNPHSRYRETVDSCAE